MLGQFPFMQVLPSSAEYRLGRLQLHTHPYIGCSPAQRSQVQPNGMYTLRLLKWFRFIGGGGGGENYFYFKSFGFDCDPANSFLPVSLQRNWNVILPFSPQTICSGWNPHLFPLRPRCAWSFPSFLPTQASQAQKRSWFYFSLLFVFKCVWRFPSGVQ